MCRPWFGIALATIAGLLACHAQAHALLSPRRLVPESSPPPNIAIPLQVKPPEPPEPQDVGQSDPPPILQETPEPASVLTGLIGAGGGVLMWWRGRRKIKQVAS